MIESLVKENIKTLKPYQIPDISCPIKLDAMENPYDLPDEIKELLKEKITGFNRYPDPLSNELRQTIAAYLGINKKEILVGNGSDELILYILLTFNAGQVVFPTPTFAMYKILSQITNTTPIGIPLTDKFELNEEKILKITRDTPSIIFLAYPNNPTGNSFSKEKVLEIIDESPTSLIIIDEAYFEFSKETFISLINIYPQVIIVRTFSKAFGLAGLRIGYLIANSQIIDELLKVKLPYNLNAFSQAVATCAIENFRYLLQPRINQIISERERVYGFLKGITGIMPYPSDANFILFKTLNIPADTLFSNLVEEGILIRNLNDDIPNCLRVTIGNEQENNAFLGKIDSICRRY
ncbi:MAG: histidinol-phosphate transaminase [bacterium]